ncbi:MAG TPA: DUF1343 domain-containing protein [Lentimicrobium sp.]|nr:DUF1343 domain-containing protein [Lentimicrobium sp.]
MRLTILSSLLLLFILTSCFQSRKVIKDNFTEKPIITEIAAPARAQKIKPGAERTGRYFGKLRQQQKRVALVANHTSLIGQTHLADSILNSGINLVKIFTPEHGFRGYADAGQEFENERDAETGLPIVSLYGKHKKPTPDDLQDIDIVVFDLQDVGVRFFTYISTMTLVMEACAENKLPILILDRPNPNGFYVDGPVLDTANRSFVGMHPVPVVYGMTLAEYAEMVNEEGWLKGGVKCELDWVPCSHYTHKDFYELPVRPSPNLPNMNSIILYPTTCFFEGTKASVGRGTDFPFSVIGYPGLIGGNITFTPVSRSGALNPPYKDQLCNGFDYRDSVISIKENPRLRIQWIIDMYKADTSQSSFFTSYFIKLAGTKQLQQQITEGMDESTIRESWEAPLREFLDKREKYLIYKDF